MQLALPYEFVEYNFAAVIAVCRLFWREHGTLLDLFPTVRRGEGGGPPF